MKTKVASFVISVMAAFFTAWGASVTRDIIYDPAIGDYGLGDLYLPDRVDEKTPMVLVIHGGGWSGLDRASIAGIAEFFQKELGFAAFNIEYRLANASARPWPACGDDCVKAAAFILTDAFKQQHGLSYSKIWICGGSAGGHLTLWTLVSLDPSKVEGAVAISAIGDPLLDFAVNAGRYNALFPAPVTTEKVTTMDPRPLITAGMAPVLCTHADIDAVVPIASHRAFETAYTNAGNRCVFFEYAHDCEANEGGHYIWRPGSNPHKLISSIEGRIRRFVQEVRGLSAPSKLPNSNRNDIYAGTNAAGEVVIDDLVNNGTVWKTGAGRTTYAAPALLSSGEFVVEAGTAAIDFRSAPAVPDFFTNLLPKVKLWLDAEKNVVAEDGQVIDWFDCREADLAAEVKTYPFATSRFAWMTNDYSGHEVTKPGEPLCVGNSNAFDYVDFGPYITGQTVIGGKWLSITNTAASGDFATWGMLSVQEIFVVIRKHPRNTNTGLGSIISLNQNTMSAPRWNGSSDKLWGATANTRADKGATRFDRADVWGADFRVADSDWHLVATRMPSSANECRINQIGCDRILASGGMQIAELILVGERLSEIDRMRIEDYLWKKYFGARQATFGKLSIDKDASVELDNASKVAGALAGGGTLKVSGPGTVTARNAGFDGEIELATGASLLTDDIPLAFTETSQKLSVDVNRIAKMSAGSEAGKVEIAASKPVAISGVKPGTTKLSIAGVDHPVRIAPPKKSGTVARAASFPNANFEVFSGLNPESSMYNFAGSPNQCTTNSNWVFDRSMYSSGGALVVVLFTNAYLRTSDSWNVQSRPWPGLGWDGRSWGYIVRGEISGFFTVPQAGFYRLQFRTSARYQNAHKDITLKIDDVEVGHTTSFDWTQFLRCEMNLPYLTAGQHKLTFSHLSDSGDTYTFDDVKILPVQLAETEPVRVAIANPSFEEPFSNLGTANSSIGTIRNFVPSEEALTGWTITGTPPNSNGFNRRIRRRWFDDVTDSADGSYAGKVQAPDEMPDGFLAARLYYDTEYSQVVIFPSAGRYRLVFHLAKRDGCDQQKVRVKVGDDLVKYVWVRETFFKRHEFVFDIAEAGEKTLAFAGVNSVENSNNYSYPDAFLDAVSCERIGDTPVNLIADGGFEDAAKIGIESTSAEYLAGGVWGGSGAFNWVSDWPSAISWPNFASRTWPDVPTTGNNAAMLRGENSAFSQIVNYPAAGRYELSFTVRTARRSSADNGDWGLAVFEGTDGETWNKLWFETALDARDERRVTVPFNVDAPGNRIIGFHLRTPHSVVGYAIIDDDELVAAPAADRTDLADYIPADLEIELATGAQLLLDFDGMARVEKVNYNGSQRYDGKALVGEISYARFPSIIQGRGRLYVRPNGLRMILK
ncbi:MAG TPA: alpha/beta hydrolase fold domain-containing protein [Kiritimatiellia bacterium]|nr:alpha/beta hydrolase fold domain-containing protein [Kiritimatiellia bacterium]